MKTSFTHNYWVLRAAGAAVLVVVFAGVLSPAGTALARTVLTGLALPACVVEKAAVPSDTTRRGSSQDSYGLPDSLLTTVVGTVIEIESHIERDGGLYLRLNVGGMGPFTIALGSLHTHPPPSKERLALYDKIRGFRKGELVEATGYMLEDGFWLTGIWRIEANEDKEYH